MTDTAKLCWRITTSRANLGNGTHYCVLLLLTIIRYLAVTYMLTSICRANSLISGLVQTISSPYYLTSEFGRDRNK